MPLPPSSVLYYPTIDIQNEEWLRSACLFWDSIRTIVPDGFSNPYSTRFAQELHNEGVLDPILVHPEMAEIESIVDDVLEYITDPACVPLIVGDSKKYKPEIIDRIAEIHPNKVPYLIR